MVKKIRAKISGSLSAQLLCGVLLSITSAAATLLFLLAVGNQLLNHTVYSDAFVKKMSDIQCGKLQDYVTQEELTKQNIQRLDVWRHQGKRLYLAIYDGDRALYTSSLRYHVKGKAIVAQMDRQDEDPEFGHTLTLFDGTQVQAFLYYYAGDAFYFGHLALSSIVAFLAFSFCFVLLVHRKISYVKKLKEELDILAGGALEYPVTVEGTDELGQLAFGIDQMRRSILTHQQTEERSRLANSQLVTAMSHDLRTPLTSLLAYLELIDRGKYENPEQLQLFVKKSLSKAFRIKTMADQMFEYFLVYSAEWEQPELEAQDADTLFSQIWGDYAFSLESKGFTVQTDFGPLSGNLQINTDLMRRAFDNLYSNLLKYADPAFPIEIRFYREENQALLSIRNRVTPQKDKRESTNIGLNTCQRILQYHGGSFETVEENDCFQVKVRLPLGI